MILLPVVQPVLGNLQFRGGVFAIFNKSMEDENGIHKWNNVYHSYIVISQNAYFPKWRPVNFFVWGRIEERPYSLIV